MTNNFKNLQKEKNTNNVLNAIYGQKKQRVAII